MPPRRVLVWSLLVAGCLGSTALAYWWLSPTPLAVTGVPAGFQLSPEVVDFGTLIQGQTTSREVRVTNATASGWVVEEVLPSCGCSAAHLSSTDLAAQSAITLGVRYNSLGKFGDQKHVVRLIVRSADEPGRKQEIIVPIAVRVEMIAYVTPETVSFKDCTLGGEYTARFTLHCAPGHAGTASPVLLASGGVDPLEFALAPRDPIREGANEMELRFTPRQSSGRRGMAVQIDPGLATHPPVPLKVDAVVASHFRVEPADVALGRLRRGEPKSVRIQLAGGSSPFVVERCPDFLEATIAGEVGHQQLTLRVRDDRLTPSTILRDAIRLKTGSAVEPIVKIPVFGVVEAAGPDQPTASPSPDPSGSKLP